MLHSYSNSEPNSYSNSASILYLLLPRYSGFTAALTVDEVAALRQSYSVVGVYRDIDYTLHTPEFLGLDVVEEGLTAGYKFDSSNVSVGVLDISITPESESESFADSGMPSISARWKGEYESGLQFSPKLYNKKLIFQGSKA